MILTSGIMQPTMRTVLEILSEKKFTTRYKRREHQILTIFQSLRRVINIDKIIIDNRVNYQRKIDNFT